jgi:hypothetical protein
MGDMVAVFDDQEFHGTACFPGQTFGIFWRTQAIEACRDDEQGALDLFCHALKR